MPNLYDLIGVPYKERGRDIKTGLDCYGLAIEVLKRYGKTLKDFYYSETTPDIAEQNEPNLNVRKTTEIKPGNLIEMTLDNRLHVGVIISKTEYIHASRRGVRISALNVAPISNIYEVF